MDSTTPKNELTLVSSSLTEDLSFLALADLNDVFAAAKNQARLIGGLMVSILAQRWNLGQELYRETHDADLGVYLPAGAVIEDRLQVGAASRDEDS